MRATSQKLSEVALGLLAVSLQMWCPALAQNGPVLTVSPGATNSANPANTPSSIKPTAPYSAQKPAVAPDLSATPSLAGQNAPSAPLSQAEIWVRDRFNPGGQSAAQMLQAKKHPVKGFFKSIAKGTAQELGASAHDMAQDMVFVFSVQDIDPYDKTRAPSNKQCVVMEFTMVDGSTAYLHQFPDGSYAIENGFADGTVMVPTSPTNYIIKYPNGVSGTVVRQSDQVTVYRPDHTITTVKKEPSGNYRISNSKFGYMGEARPDDTGNQYGIGAWNYQ